MNKSALAIKGRDVLQSVVKRKILAKKGTPMTIHNIPPIFDAASHTLILGSFPSVRSREEAFFYAHPQNRFWRVVAAVFAVPIPHSTAEKTALLLRHGIALWDVIASCEVDGSADSTIKNVVPNDLTRIFSAAPLTRVFTNGKTADALYRKYLLPQTGREAVCLPSTSPANAAWSPARLTEAWSIIRRP